MSTFLYRAVNAEPMDVADGYDDDGIEYTLRYQPGEWTFGRQSGYLSRSGAKAAGFRSGVAFEIVKSEPVVFLTAEQRLVREIRELTEELERVRLGVLKAVA